MDRKLTAKDLSCGYRDKKGSVKEILRCVSFELESGDILAVTGDNGSGKSTLLRCLSGAAAPLSGERELTGDGIPRISFVAQLSASPLPLSCLDAVVLGRAPFLGKLSSPTRKDRDLALSALERMGIKDLAGTACDRISGGEYRLVCIARALVSEPDLIVLDEPEASLDSKNRRRLCECLKELAAEGRIIVYSTHFAANAARTASKVLHIENGAALLIPPERAQEFAGDY